MATNLYPPYARGGSERVARLSAEAWVRAGHQVVVLTAAPFSGAPSLLPKRVVESGLVVYRWFPLNLYFYAEAATKPVALRLVWTFFDVFNIHSYLIARWVLHKEQPDLVVSHNLKGLGYTLARACARGSWRYIHVLHDVQLAYPTGVLYPATSARELSRWSVRIYMAVNRWLFRRVLAVVAPSKFLLDFYRSLNFFPQAETRRLLNPVAAQPNVSVPHSGINIVFFELELHKGLDVLLEVWQSVTDQDVMFHLAGGGSQTHYAAEHVQGEARVRMFGRLSAEENEALWSTADIVVAPSLCLENSPTVIAEALARGVYVIASNVGGVPELAALSRSVRLIPPGDVAALAQALQDTISTVRNGVRPAVVALPNPDEYIQALSR